MKKADKNHHPERDLRELQQENELLEKYLEHYRSLIKNIPDVIWTTDINRNITFISPNVIDVYGFTPDEIYEGGDKLWLRRIHPDDLDKVKSAFHDLFDKGKPLDVDYRIQNKDGEWIWLQDKSIGTYEKDGVKYADGVFIDITERIRLKNELKKQLLRNEEILNTSLNGHLLADLKGNIIDANPAYCEMVGYSRDELLRMNIRELEALIKPENIEKTIQNIVKQEHIRFETKHRCKDGSLIDLDVSVVLMQLESPPVISAFVNDISEQKKHEELLKNIADGISRDIGKEFFSSLVEQLSTALKVDFAFIGILSTEKEKTVNTVAVYAVDKIIDNFEYELTGTPCEQVVGEKLCSFPEKVFEQFPDDHMLGEMGIEGYIGMPLFGENNLPLGLIVIMDRKPITNESQAKYLLQIFSVRASSEIVRQHGEKTLKESENKFRAIFNHAIDGILIADIINKTFQVGNPEICRMLGYREDELMKMGVKDIHPEKDIPFALSQFEKLVTGEIETAHNIPVLRKNGSIFYADIHASIVTLQGKQCLMGIFRDITARRKALVDLKTSEEKFRMIFENSPLGIIHFDENGEVTDLNDIMPGIIGAPKEKIIGFNMITSVKDKAMSTAVTDCLTSGRGHFEGDYVTILGNRSIILKVDFRSARLGDTDGIGGIGIFEDITDRRKSELVLSAILKQEEAVSELGQNALEGIDLRLLMNEAVRLVSNTLDVEYSKVLELLPDKKESLLKAGTGWKEGLVGSATVGADDNSQAGYTLSTGNPVIVDDLRKETRFKGPQLLIDHGVISGISVVIGSIEKPYGVLGAHTSVKRAFKKHDVHFLIAISNVLGSAIRRKEYEELLYQSKHDWEETFNTITDMVTVQDMDFNIINSNKAAEKILRLPDSEVVKKVKCFEYYHGSDCPPKECPSCECLKTGESLTFSVFEPHLNMFLESRAMPRFDENHNMIGLIHVVRDITEQKKLEDQLRHSQKMEAVGQLAGGVAHDFNNILTAIIGYGNLLNMKLRKDDPLKHNVEQIIRITERGAGLTQSLLTFSRKQVIDLKPVNINKVLETSINVLPRLIRENIEIKAELSEESLFIMADSIQIEQIMMNLASNARDSMPDGGIFSIKTEFIIIDTEYIRTYGFGKHGEYALLTITDTGAGMDNDIKDKIFEPFFSTKKMGQGTGLGLSIVYGIVKQHSGFINVYSEKGIGTSFRIFFPLIKDLKKDEKAAVIEPTGGNEVVLIAEDDDEVRTPLKVILENYGYEVIEAVDGKDALEKFKVNKDRIKLIVFDVIMPRMNGKTAYDKIKAMNPDISVIFTSGHTEDTLQTKEILDEGLLFISKPVSPFKMLAKIREVLDR